MAVDVPVRSARISASLAPPTASTGLVRPCTWARRRSVASAAGPGAWRSGAAEVCRAESTIERRRVNDERMELLRTRYSAAKLGAPSPSAAAMEAMLEAAARSPDHGRLRPWRLILIEGDARRAFGKILAESLLRRSPDAGDQALAREREKALRAPVIVVVATRCDR